MKTAILEILTEEISDEFFSEFAHPDNIRKNIARQIHQLLCDSMATAMYRCTMHLSARRRLCRKRMAEYGFSKEEIELAINKLDEND